MAKSLLRLQARELRKQGMGIKTIAATLQVSSSTVSLWCKDIELTPEQIKQLELRAKDPFYGRRLQNVKLQQEKRLQKIKQLHNQGVEDVGFLSDKELFVAGTSLYWAEGFKKDNQVGFSNSDPTMIKFFILWLEKCCHIQSNQLKFRVGVNEMYKEKVHVIEEFWIESLNISINQFQKPFFQKSQWKKIYDNPETYHGVLRVRVCKSSDLLRRIHGWIDGLRIGNLQPSILSLSSPKDKG